MAMVLTFFPGENSSETEDYVSVKTKETEAYIINPTFLTLEHRISVYSMFPRLA